MLWWIYIGVVAVMSVAAFVTYGWDKRQAKRNKLRIAERKLHTMALLGGWPGALAGRAAFRHKTRKRSFTMILAAAAVIHIAGVAFFIGRSM